jgi:hypothetical protein
MSMHMESWYAVETKSVTVPQDKVACVVGTKGQTISNIAMQTGTSIISPRKGQDPVFVITGMRYCVVMAVAAIEAKASDMIGATRRNPKRYVPSFSA